MQYVLIPGTRESLELHPVRLRTGHLVAGTRDRRNRNRPGPTHGIAGIFTPGTRHLFYTEPPRLAYTSIYTYTAAAVPLGASCLSPLETKDRD